MAGKSSTAQRIILSIILVSGLIYFFNSLVLQKKRAEIKRLRKEYTEIETAIKKAKKSVSNYQTLKAEYDSVSLIWKDLEESLPQSEEMPELLRGITITGRRIGIDFLLFKPLPPVSRGFYTENPVQIKVACNYHKLGFFLSKLANLKRLITIRNLRLSSSKSEKPNQSLKAELIATAYATNNLETSGRGK